MGSSLVLEAALTLPGQCTLHAPKLGQSTSHISIGAANSNLLEDLVECLKSHAPIVARGAKVPNV